MALISPSDKVFPRYVWTTKTSIEKSSLDDNSLSLSGETVTLEGSTDSFKGIFSGTFAGLASGMLSEASLKVVCIIFVSSGSGAEGLLSGCLKVIPDNSLLLS